MDRLQVQSASPPPAPKWHAAALLLFASASVLTLRAKYPEDERGVRELGAKRARAETAHDRTAAISMWNRVGGREVVAFGICHATQAAQQRARQMVQQRTARHRDVRKMRRVAPVRLKVAALPPKTTQHGQQTAS